MFRRDVYIPPPANLLQPKLRCLGDALALHSIKMLEVAYMLAAVNLKKVRDRQLKKVIKEIPTFKVSALL